MEKLVSIDPSNGEEVGSVLITPIEEISRIVLNAKERKKNGGAYQLKKEQGFLMRSLMKYLIMHMN